MKYFLIILIFMLFVLIYMRLETYQLRLTLHTFQRKKRKNHGTLTFLHFTDLHLGRTSISTNKIIEIVSKEPSDFLVFTGDYFERDNQIPKLYALMDAIRAVYTNPIYLCFGNHDNHDVFSVYTGTREEVVNQLTQRQITILENESAAYQKEHLTLRVIGLSDVRTNEADIPQIIAAHRSDNPDIPNLLITHNSDILMKMEPGSVDFAVAGHTHGAQVRTPFNIETKLLHRKDTLSSQENIIRGSHSYKEMDLYISRGLGCSVFPIRFLSKPEIVCYRIEY